MESLALTNLNGVGALPGLSLQFAFQTLATVFLASLRIGAFLIASPFFGGSATPIQVRIIMAVLLGFFVTSNVSIPDWESFDAMTGFTIVLVELLIGIGAGLILTIWFSAALLAGEKIAASAGLGFAAQMDPDSGGQTPVVSKVFSLFLTVLFLSWDGHLLVLQAILGTYQVIPVGSIPNLNFLVLGGLSAAGSMFASAAIIMLPITGLLVAINLAVGVISRSSPQMNLFAVGFPISMIVVFVLLYIWVDVLGYSLTELSQSGVEAVNSVLEKMIDG